MDLLVIDLEFHKFAQHKQISQPQPHIQPTEKIKNRVQNKKYDYRLIFKISEKNLEYKRKKIKKTNFSSTASSESKRKSTLNRIFETFIPNSTTALLWIKWKFHKNKPFKRTILREQSPFYKLISVLPKRIHKYILISG